MQNLFSIVLGGLVDSMNPCSAAILIVFVFLLLRVSKRPQLMLYAGMVYIGICYVLSFFLMNGWCEERRDTADFYLACRIFFILLGVLSILGGWRCVRIWGNRRLSKVRKNENSSDGPITPMNAWDEKKTDLFSQAAFVFPFFSFLSVVNTLLRTVCPVQFYVATSVYSLFMEKLNAAAYLNMLFYLFFFVLPMILALLIIYTILSSEKMMRLVRPYLLTLRIVCAAFLFSIGIGLIYTFL